VSKCFIPGKWASYPSHSLQKGFYILETGQSLSLYGVPEFESRDTKSKWSRLSAVVVSVVSTGPKGLGFKPGRGNGFLKAIKICSTPYFGWEVKPEAACSKILGMLKNLAWYVS
jgi:hypothetical protein